MKDEKINSEKKPAKINLATVLLQMIQKKEEIKSEEKIEQDPTRFGDWQVNCRAIDF